MDGNGGNAGHRWHVVGWLLFILCAFLFIWSSCRNGDLVALAASLVFLLACLLFLVPLLLRRR